MIHGHGGNIEELARKLECSIEEIVDMSSNLNPLGPPKDVETIIFDNIKKIRSLPQADAGSMLKAFANYTNTDENHIIAANGTTWFIYTIPLALKAKKVLIVGPTYSDYMDACIMHGIKFEHCIATPESNFLPSIEKISSRAKEADVLFICNPNNPTGTLLPTTELVKLIESHKNTNFVIDESYLPFVENAQELSLINQHDLSNLIVLSSMSKIFTIPGLRTGFLTASPEIVEKIMKYYQPWSVNSLAQETVTSILEQKEKIEPFYEETRTFVKKEKDLFYNSLAKEKNIYLFDSSAYFVLARLSKKMDASSMCDFIGQQKILIRNCSNFYGLNDEYVRFSLKTSDHNIRLVQLIKQVFNNAD